jgi:predicted dehydrogenase
MDEKYEVRLLTADPGHFHAALVQKTMYPQVAPDVYVYAPEGLDCRQHLERIASYNKRPVNPTAWNEIVYTGPGFFEKMLQERKGNVVVLSGNNGKKAEYIDRCIKAGLNVLADKPMIISKNDFPTLVNDFRAAREKGILLYDIMTERYEITTILQKLLSQEPSVFGRLENGSADDPAVTKISVHHFSKMVSGVPLQRPAWYFDVKQQGEGIVDVTTHLVDLVQWECFPDKMLDTSDVLLNSARRWPTPISPGQFRKVTGLDSFPAFLKDCISDSILNVYSNGEMVYMLNGVWAKVSVTWNFEPVAGGGDTHFSVMRGTGCSLVIKQGPEEKFVPMLYITNIKGDGTSFLTRLGNVLKSLPYDSLEIEKLGNGDYRISVPSRYRVSHEEHFGQVTAKFLEYLKRGELPQWEVKAMITKYFTTTSALRLALSGPLEGKAGNASK